MAAGLQVFDQYGRLVVDLSTRMPRIIGSVYSGTSASAIADGGLAQGEPFYFSVVAAEASFNAQRGPVAYFSGTTMSWSFPNLPAVPATIFYGVY